MESAIRLFKALPVKSHDDIKQYDATIIKECIPRGFILSPEVASHYSGDIDRIINLVHKVAGISAKEINSTFHKSWDKIRNASLDQLLLEQAIHYVTTYGFEALGIDNDYVYIPDEAINIPDIDASRFPLVMIKGYTKEELKAKAMDLLGTGIALEERTISDVVDVLVFTGLDEKELELVRNKETRILLYKYLNILPSDPTEMLRYLVHMATNNTLLIKNPSTILSIKERNNMDVAGAISRYSSLYGLSKLATIFYRFKPIFLAFRTNSALKKAINKIRKLAPKNHIPMKGDYLNEVTARISHGSYDEKILRNKLENANAFRKIRLAYALKYRTNENADSILYKIRNGKSYVEEFDFDNKEVAQQAFEIVKGSIVSDLRKNVEGKKIFIPDNMIYALPATEKQFSGNLPSGTCVVVPNNIMFGIYWEDLENERVDLDLSMVNADIKIGWDSHYRTNNILFSGDMTSAQNGATELFYVTKEANGAYVIYVNHYNREENDVPFKTIVAKEEVNGPELDKGHMIDPNDVVCSTNSVVKSNQQILGVVVIEDDCRFYFSESQIFNSITSMSPTSRNVVSYLHHFYTNTIDLNQMLVEAGAILSFSPSDCDINLLPEKVEKDTIINLFR